MYLIIMDTMKTLHLLMQQINSRQQILKLQKLIAKLVKKLLLSFSQQKLLKQMQEENLNLPKWTQSRLKLKSVKKLTSKKLSIEQKQILLRPMLRSQKSFS